MPLLGKDGSGPAQEHIPENQKTMDPKRKDHIPGNSSPLPRNMACDDWERHKAGACYSHFTEAIARSQHCPNLSLGTVNMFSSQSISDKPQTGRWSMEWDKRKICIILNFSYSLTITKSIKSTLQNKCSEFFSKAWFGQPENSAPPCAKNWNCLRILEMKSRV